MSIYKILFFVSLILVSTSLTAKHTNEYKFKSITYKEYSNICSTKYNIEIMKQYLPKGYSCIDSFGYKGETI